MRSVAKTRQKSPSRPRRWLTWLAWAAVLLVGSLLGLLLVSGGRWDGKSRFTVVEMRGPGVEIKSFDPATRRGIELVLPADLEIATLRRGRFSAGSLAAAGSLDWAAASVAHDLGLFIVGEISRLSRWDSWLWWWWARRVQWQRVDVAGLGLVDYVTSADGARVGRLGAGWNQAAREWFISLVVAQEELTLRVVNTTSVAGLAAVAARPIETSGIKVVETTTQPQLRDGCLLAGPAALRQRVGVQLLLRNLGCDGLEEAQTLTLYLGREYQEAVGGD